MTEIISVLFAAASSEYGVVVRSNKPKACGAALYREIYKNPEFSSLGVVQKGNGEIWVVKKISTERPDNELSLEVAEDEEI